MRHILLILVLLLSCGSLEAQKLNLMSYNVRNAKGMDNVINYGRVADVIKKSKADVVAVQEIDSVSRRANGAYVLEEIASRAGYGCSYAPAISFQGGKYGIGILYRKKPLRTYNVPLPGREEERTLLVAEFRKYIVCVVHLSLTEEDRMASIGIILREVLKLGVDKPVFLAGDFNAYPSSPFMKALEESFEILSDTSVYTFPSDVPDRTIDYICSRKSPKWRMDVLDYKVVEEKMASDHRPISLKVRIRR